MNVRETDKFLEGKEEGLLEAAISFMQKFNLTSEQAAIAIGVPLTKLQEALKKSRSTITTGCTKDIKDKKSVTDVTLQKHFLR